MFAELGFRQFSPRAWESSRVELGVELSALRARLDGKWRNMLAFSEKAALSVEQRSDAVAFDWMAGRYQELMRAKNFTGPSISFLAALRKHLGEESPLLILRAMADGEPVAAICLVFHGTTATYLLGWNSEKGRTLKANQYLLWQAIVHLKQCGMRWLDLGGISEEHTPGITAFKLGLNGTRYELVGEYWKW
jgi:Acetyltransferase (GNAT) domain